MQNSDLLVSQKADVPLKLDCPPDKSLSHRALFFSLFSKNKVFIDPILYSLDTQASFDCLKQLLRVLCPNAQLSAKKNGPSNNTASFSFNPGFSILSEVDLKKRALVHLNALNSGTTARFLLGLTTAIPHLKVVLDGDESLRRRPMKRVWSHLLDSSHVSRPDGSSLDASDFPSRELPIAFEGGECDPTLWFTSHNSAQWSTALILHLLMQRKEGGVIYRRGGRNHTQKLLQSWNAPLSFSFLKDLPPALLGLSVARLPLTVDLSESLIASAETTESPDSEWVILRRTSPSVPAQLNPPSQHFKVPGDPSSAIFLIAAAIMLNRRLSLEGLNGNAGRWFWLAKFQKIYPWLTVAFREDFEYLESDVLDITIHAGKSSAIVTHEELIFEEAETAACLDEIPILSLLFAWLGQPVCFESIGELRLKESNRVATTSHLINLFTGVSMTSIDQNLNLIVEKPLMLQAGALRSSGLVAKLLQLDVGQDHRLAMCAGLLASALGGRVDDDSQLVKIASVSYPSFFKDLQKLL